MYIMKPITDRVLKMRERYRETAPELCISRYKLITEFYMEHPEMHGIIKRAKCFKYICENIPVEIFEDEVIVGVQAEKFRSAAIYPENSVDWLKEELSNGRLSTREIDPYIISEEDKKYVLDTVDFWMKECQSAQTDAYILEEFLPHVNNNCSGFGAKGQTASPVGHFCTGYHNAIDKGLGAIRDEASDKMKEIIDAAVPGDSIDRYNFYRAVTIVCDAMITLTKRYAAKATEMEKSESDPDRKLELSKMADTLNWCMEKPCRNFLDAVQTLFMYQTCLCLDANMHGISFGRVDQYLGKYLERDLENGEITENYAQEIMDLLFLKVAEMNKPWGYIATMSNPGYTTGQLMTLGGVKKDGTDASNKVTYMMLQTSGRLMLHTPPLALRIHKNTPKELWETAIETTKIAGGVPTFENDDVIIPAMMGRGHSIESARNYCLIGCVEPGGCGNEWPACGGTGTESYMNLVGGLWLAINNGYNPMRNKGICGMPDRDDPIIQVGEPTGYLYEMESMDQVLSAYKRQIEFGVKWHASNINSFEYVGRQNLPLPVVSCTMDGCMEKGMDVMFGGAEYNSTGISGVGIGNVADSLYAIDYLCFQNKICTTRELYDALMADWKGYENLQSIVINECPHYGNGDEEADKYVAFASKVFSDAVNSKTGPRGRFSAGLYPVTINVMHGYKTAATPDGRNAGQPLADGISPVQQHDTNGPTGVLASVSKICQTDFPNGTLLNMKFHPGVMQGEDGIDKLSKLMQTYFDMGGMEMQINIVSTDILRDAQEDPKKYKDLVVRVAGFSAYFVELHPDGQNDLIRRTELASV